MKNKRFLTFVRKKVKSKKIDRTYQENRVRAKKIIENRVQEWSIYFTSYKRITIRNQKSRWGSCSSLRNLNFNYKIIFLPYELADYIIVHELAHLEEMHHGPLFWKRVEEILPDYGVRKSELLKIEKQFGISKKSLTAALDHYPGDATTLEKLMSDKVATVR